MFSQNKKKDTRVLIKLLNYKFLLILFILLDSLLEFKKRNFWSIFSKKINLSLVNVLNT